MGIKIALSVDIPHANSFRTSYTKNYASIPMENEN
jgi:hypothetical protein